MYLPPFLYRILHLFTNSFFTQQKEPRRVLSTIT
nr:MAG TPA: hypothetical protein [Caudoviricetes sp.]